MFYVVTGLARSGTNMLMNALGAGGMHLSYLEAPVSVQNEHHQPGYTPRAPYREAGRSMDGSVCLKYPWEVVSTPNLDDYRVVMLHRPLLDRLTSYRKAFRTNPAQLQWEMTGQNEFTSILQQRMAHHLTVLHYDHLVYNTYTILTQLDWPFDTQAATDWIRGN